MSEGTVRIRVRHKLLVGELPLKPPRSVWGGAASNRCCAVCDSAISLFAEIEADSADGRRRYYHVSCFRILQSERDLL